MNRLILKSGEDRRLLRGHLWAYRSDFTSITGTADGAVVDVYTQQGKFVGRGFFQAEGGIAVRILSRHQSPVDGEWIERRIDDALGLRRRLFPDTQVYRWIHGESDGLPGLLADRYGAVVSAQSSAAFYANHAEELMAAFMAADGIAGVRLAVGDALYTQGELPPTIEIDVEGLKYGFALDASQKTGFFLDQRLNATLMDTLAKGVRVLDGHCYHGQWSCRAARAGAAEVIGVDSSAAAIDAARANAERNGLTVTFEEGQVETYLNEAGPFGLICLDPPALAKSRAGLPKAQKRYQSLNRDAIAALEPGGFLVTSSCSHLIDEGVFLETLKRAARSAQRQAVILERRGAPPDHPVLMSMPETGYLNCIALRIL